jgi:hypothetical protein
MILIVVYVVLVAIGEVIAFGIGAMLDGMFPTWSMILYMALFFGVIAGAWPVAVFVTEKYIVTESDKGPVKQPAK